MSLRETMGHGFYDRVHLAVVTAIEADDGFVSVIFLDQVAVRDKIPLPVIGMSGDAWIRFVPQVNDVVMLALRPDDSAVVVGWFPFQYKNRTGNFEKDEANAAGVIGVKEMMQRLKPGEIDMRAKGGGYLRLDAIGDVLMMSLAGRIHMYGREGFTEVSQYGFKVTDGKSWMRFGAPFRLFPQVSAREIPTSGTGAPLNKPSDIRERDTRIFDTEGNLLVQESLGTVVDEQGFLDLSGTTGGGDVQGISKTFKQASSAASFVSDAADPAVLAKKLQGVVDQVKTIVQSVAATIQSGVSTVVTGVTAVYSNMGKTAHFTGSIANVVDDVKGVIAGAGAIANGLGELKGLGDIGKKVRYRLLVNKGGKQVAAYDIDEDGGIVMSSESKTGIGINANKGSFNLFARKGVKLFADGVIGQALTIMFSAARELKLVAGTKMSRSAPTITDAADSISQAAAADASYGAGTTLKLTVGGASVEVTPATINVTGGGTVNIDGSGTVNISGGLVAISGGLVTIN